MGATSSLYNVEHLLELWDEIHARLPRARLWLVGGASEWIEARVRACATTSSSSAASRVRKRSRQPLRSTYYPRTEDKGIQAAKVAEFIGLGVPTVSYDYEVTENLRETGAGVLVPTFAGVRRRRRPARRG